MGLDIPDNMQGRSLLPFISGQSPSNWRDSFIFSYSHDPEFPSATIRPYVAIRHQDGTKLVNYAENSSWNELFLTDVTNPHDADSDPYEVSNLYSSAEHYSTRNAMEKLLRERTKQQGFLKIIQSSGKQRGGTLTVQAGNSSHFILEASDDLSNWTEIGRFEGNGSESTLSLVNLDSNSTICLLYTSPSPRD